MVVIQKNYRAFSGRKKFLCLKKAAIILQKQRRGQLARRVYRERLEEKRRQEEERRKEEEERCRNVVWHHFPVCATLGFGLNSLYFRLFLIKWVWKPLLLLLKEACSCHHIHKYVLGYLIFGCLFHVISLSWAIALQRYVMSLCWAWFTNLFSCLAFRERQRQEAERLAQQVNDILNVFSHPVYLSTSTQPLKK